MTQFKPSLRGGLGFRPRWQSKPFNKLHFLDYFRLPPRPLTLGPPRNDGLEIDYFQIDALPSLKYLCFSSFLVPLVSWWFKLPLTFNFCYRFRGAFKPFLAGTL